MKIFFHPSRIWKVDEMGIRPGIGRVCIRPMYAETFKYWNNYTNAQMLSILICVGAEIISYWFLMPIFFSFFVNHVPGLACKRLRRVSTELEEYKQLIIVL
jgi:hypothetical protein